MAENKKSFVLYADYNEIFEQLTDDEAGKLVKHLFRYVNDKNPVIDDRLLKILFEPIKQQLKRDLKKWEHKRQKLSEAGKASATKRQQMLTDVEQPQHTPTVTVTDNVTATVTVIESTAPAPDLKDSNLFKQPKIPTKQQTLEAILKAGGDKEMAKSFYEKHESTGWFLNGSAITNYTALASRFVSNWKKNNIGKNNSESSGPKLSISNGI